MKVHLTQPIDYHMYGPESHLSVWLLFSALSLLPVDLGYTEVTRQRSHILLQTLHRFCTQVNKGNFVTVLESFTNNSYKMISFLSSDSGMVIKL